MPKRTLVLLEEQGVAILHRPLLSPLWVAGTLVVAAGKHRLYNDLGVNLVIEGFRVSVGTAPTGASLIIDVNKGGTTLFTTQGNRPVVAAGANTAKWITLPDIVAWNDGEYLTVDVDQIGSTIAGADLSVQPIAKRASS